MLKQKFQLKEQAVNILDFFLNLQGVFVKPTNHKFGYQLMHNFERNVGEGSNLIWDEIILLRWNYPMRSCLNLEPDNWKGIDPDNTWNG